jgi:hypothetical protein
MIELLYFHGCPSAAEAEALVRRILVEEGRTAPLLKIAVETPEQHRCATSQRHSD